MSKLVDNLKKMVTSTKQIEKSALEKIERMKKMDEGNKKAGEQARAEKP